MRNYYLLLLTAGLLCLPLPAKAQNVSTDKDKDNVRRVVETYLYAEEPEERKRTTHGQAKIFSLDPGGGRVIETAISKPARKLPGRVVVRSRQKIISIDMTDGAASVKVETDFSSDTAQSPKHAQYLSLLKVNGEWKIVSILMPPSRLIGRASK